MTNKLIFSLIIFSCFSALCMEKEKLLEIDIDVDPTGVISGIKPMHTILDVKHTIRYVRAFPVESQIICAYKDGNTNIDSSSAPLSNTILVHKAVQDYNTHNFWVSIKPNLMGKPLCVGPHTIPMRTVTFTIGAYLPLENSGLAAGIYTKPPSGPALYLATIADDWYVDLVGILNKKRSCKKNQQHELLQYTDNQLSKIDEGLRALKALSLKQLEALPEDESKEKEIEATPKKK